jgi:hypothetical protein
MGDNGFFMSESKGSQFWKSLDKIKHWFKMATSYAIGDERKVLLWHDVWIEDCPRKILFPSLFECCEQPEITVRDALHCGGLNLSFCRSFGPREVEQWGKLGQVLEHIGLRAKKDNVCWELERHKKLSTHSLYRFIMDPGVKDLRAMEIWTCKIPLKQKNLLWLCFRGKIQSARELAERGWSGSPLCGTCAVVEDTNHILFTYPVARYIWCIIRDMFEKSYIPGLVRSLLISSSLVEGQNQIN